MMTPTQYAKVLGLAPWYFLGGVAVAISGFFTHHFITLTGFMAVALGAGARGMSQEMLRHPLMWVISGLLWFIIVMMYLTMAYLEIRQLIRGGDESLLAALGLAASTHVLWVLSRFLWTFTSVNWRARQ